MRVLLPLLIAALTLGACRGDETVAAYSAGQGTWVLAEVDGTDPGASLTLHFGEDGQVSGSAPCNRFSAQNTAPYPWFTLSPIAATKRACSELAQEQMFLTLLQAMTQSEISGNVMILRTGAGREMLFRSDG
ncbi:META domain-containing protein [Epibacterium ulvae]|uniref:META domain-containing protein n=1 Tax=Epibacterium ulvae TaxID=1156985 RepID=UPI001BFC1A18|nr:META domain-containing protein [Epibacterium ulvae]MBT8153387.1 META domain-containing protein [Epibacterium ulvae]